MSSQNWKEKYEFLKYIISVMPGNIYWKDKNGVFQGCNNNLARIHNLKLPDEIVGLTDHDVLDQKQADVVSQTDINVMADGSEKSLEENGFSEGGAAAVYLTRKVPVYDKSHNVIGMVGISIDITDRKKAEEALKVAKEQAEEASKFKTRFMENMEHDLRTPLIGVVMASEYLANNPTDPKLTSYLHDVANSGNQLLKFLNEILHASRAQAGKIPVCLTKIDLLKSIDGIIAMQRPIASNKQLALTFNYQPDIPHIVVSDEHRIARILVNLLGNAVKFTKQGFVKIGLEVAKKIDDRHVVLKLTVADSGMGISQKLQTTMYDRFVRGTPSNQGIYSGSGLGLSIVKQFLEELGGTISVESEVDKGTTFTCLIPVELPQVEKQSSLNAVEANQSIGYNELKIKILLVEDSETVRNFALKMLTNMLPLAKIDMAETGQSAIELAAKNNYDIIFMDLGLPDIDGYEVTKAICKKFPATIIVALTAQESSELKSNCLNAGMNDAFNKPLDTAKIQVALQLWMDKKNGINAAQSALNKIIDWTIARKSFGDIEQAKKVLINFGENLEASQQEIDGAINTNDFSTVAFIANRIKGDALCCGAEKLTIASSSLYAAAQKEDKKSIKDAFTQLKSAIKATVDEIVKCESKF